MFKIYVGTHIHTRLIALLGPLEWSSLRFFLHFFLSFDGVISLSISCNLSCMGWHNTIHLHVCWMHYYTPICYVNDCLQL